MKLHASILLLFIPLLVGSFGFAPPADVKHNITLTVTNIRSSKGRIQVQVYRTGESFGAETPYKVLYISKKNMSKKTVTYTIYGLKTGTYGLALLDDENANKEMDYGLMMPKEGFGFSDYYHTAWSKPKFKQFKFSLTTDKSVGVKVRYM